MKSIDKLNQTIASLGSDVIAYDDNGNTIHGMAVIISSSSIENKSLQNDFNVFGYLDTEKYSYIGTVDLRLDLMPKNTVITVNDIDYVVLKSEKICFKNQIAYIKAILQKYVSHT